MKIAALEKQLSQLNAKLRLFLRWNTAQGISNYGSHRVRNTILQILKLEAKIAKIEKLEQSQILPSKEKNQSSKTDYNRKANPKIFKAFQEKFKDATIIIPQFDEETEKPPKLSIKFKSGEISIINYQILPSDYFKSWNKGKTKHLGVSTQLHGLYAAIGATLAKR